jgi:hypothetical protein
MANAYNTTWKLGETWGLLVDCKNADGTPLSPDAARFTLYSDLGVALDLQSDDVDPQITIAGDVVTISIPEAGQADIGVDVYQYDLEATAGDVESFQIAGTINIQPSSRSLGV